MDRKGQMVSVGGLVMLAMALIVGAIVLQAAAQNVGSVTNTITLENVSMGAAVANNTAQYITDYRAINNLVVYNATGDHILGSGNYTAENNVVYNGALSVKITPTYSSAIYASGGAWLLSGTAEPTTYGDSAGRSMASLIIIMMALALVAVAVVYAVKNYQ